MQTQEAGTTQPANQQGAMRQVAEMQAEALTQIVGLHLDRLMGIMVSTNGVDFQRKLQAAKALKEAVAYALDFGLGVTETKIRGKGQPLAKETNELAAVLVKAFDNRMLLLADNLRQAEEQEVELPVGEQNQTQEETTVQGEQ